jgi:hypothetical protein
MAMTGPDPDFSVDVLRAADLLALTFGFVNLRVEFPDGQPPQVSRMTAGQPAYIIVELPPQHIAEQYMSDSFFTPSAALADRSRLVFAVPDDAGTFPFALAHLLDWSGQTLSVTANAVVQPAGPDRPAPAEPTTVQTAIELPYRLILSPDAGGAWANAVDAVTHDGVTEVWHTRLGVGQDGRVDETRMPTLRAVWARDLGGAPPDSLGSALDGVTRGAIAHLSSDFSQTVMRFGPGFGTGGEEDPYDPPPLAATHLVLSALGGWTDLSGSWDFPDDLQQVWPSFPVIGWRHITAQGRDQYVRVVKKGLLYPLGHRAVFAQVIERRLAPGTATDYLCATSRVCVREPVRDYTQASASHPHDAMLPLRQARIETLVTPDLAAPTAASFVPTGLDNVPFAFHVVGQDWQGGRVDLRMPLVFVPADDAGAGAVLYTDEIRTVGLQGQPVALAPDPPAPGGTTLPVQSLTLTADIVPTPGSPLLPYVETASVNVPAIDHLVGSAAPAGAVSIELRDPASTAGEVFARITSANGGLALDLPTDRAGGLVRPNLSIGGISRSLGAVPGGLDALADPTQTFDPATLFSQALGDATLLGGISLKDVIGHIVDLSQLPSLSHTDGQAGSDVVFSWQPPLKEFGPLKLDIGGSSALNLRTAMHLPRGEGTSPQFTVDGSLTNFAIDFVNVVRISFTSLSFAAALGRKMDVDPRGVRLDLRNELSFLNALADVLPADGFSDPPALTVTQDGVTATYSLGLPSAGIGIFNLEQVALSAGITLPFVAQPAVLRLAFSDAAHPFLVTVAMIGGGGFFALEVDTGGIRRIEGSIEVGANLSVDLGIVAANVHVMAGFYFGLRIGPDGHDAIEFSAYLRIGGAVELLGIAGISIDIYLAMTYESSPVPRIGGSASVVVGVHLLMFATSVRLHTQRYFAIPSHDPAFDDLVDGDDWETYCRAFA